MTDFEDSLTECDQAEPDFSELSVELKQTSEDYTSLSTTSVTMTTERVTENISITAKPINVPQSTPLPQSSEVVPKETHKIFSKDHIDEVSHRLYKVLFGYVEKSTSKGSRKTPMELDEVAGTYRASPVYAEDSPTSIPLIDVDQAELYVKPVDISPLTPESITFEVGKESQTIAQTSSDVSRTTLISESVKVKSIVSTALIQMSHESTTEPPGEVLDPPVADSRSAKSVIPEVEYSFTITLPITQHKPSSQEENFVTVLSESFMPLVPESTASETEKKPLSPDSGSEYATKFVVSMHDRSSSPESVTSHDRSGFQSPDSPILEYRPSTPDSSILLTESRASSPESLSSVTELSLPLPDLSIPPLPSPEIKWETAKLPAYAPGQMFRPLTPMVPNKGEFTRAISPGSESSYCRSISPESVIYETEDRASSPESVILETVRWHFSSDRPLSPEEDLQKRVSSPESTGSVNEHRPLSPDSPVPEFRQVIPESVISTSGYRSFSPESETSVTSETEYIPLEDFAFWQRPDSPESTRSVDEHRFLSPDSPIPQFWQSEPIALVTFCTSSSSQSIFSDVDYETAPLVSLLYKDRPSSPESAASIDEYGALSPDSPIPQFRHLLPDSIVDYRSDSPESVSSDTEYVPMSLESIAAAHRSDSPEALDFEKEITYPALTKSESPKPLVFLSMTKAKLTKSETVVPEKLQLAAESFEAIKPNPVMLETAISTGMQNIHLDIQQSTEKGKRKLNPLSAKTKSAKKKKSKSTKIDPASESEMEIPAEIQLSESALPSTNPPPTKTAEVVTAPKPAIPKSTKPEPHKVLSVPDVAQPSEDQHMVLCVSPITVTESGVYVPESPPIIFKYTAPPFLESSKPEPLEGLSATGDEAQPPEDQDMALCVSPITVTESGIKVAEGPPILTESSIALLFEFSQPEPQKGLLVPAFAQPSSVSPSVSPITVSESGIHVLPSAILVPEYRLVYDAELWKLISQVNDPQYVGETYCSKTGVFEYAGQKIEYEETSEAERKSLSTDSPAEEYDSKTLSPDSLSEYRPMSSSSLMLLKDITTMSPASTGTMNENRSLSPDSPVPKYSPLFCENVQFHHRSSSSESDDQLPDDEVSEIFESRFVAIEGRPLSPESTGSVSENSSLSKDEDMVPCVSPITVTESGVEVPESLPIIFESTAQFFPESCKPEGQKILYVPNLAQPSIEQDLTPSMSTITVTESDADVPESPPITFESTAQFFPESSKPEAQKGLSVPDLAQTLKEPSVSPVTVFEEGIHVPPSVIRVPVYKLKYDAELWKLISPIHDPQYVGETPKTGIFEYADNIIEYVQTSERESQSSSTEVTEERPLTPDSESEYRPLSPESVKIKTVLRSDSAESVKSLKACQCLSPNSLIPQYSLFFLETAQSYHRSFSPESVSDADFEIDSKYSIALGIETRSSSPESLGSVHEHRPLSPDSPVPPFRQVIPESVLGYRSSSLESVTSETKHILSEAFSFWQRPDSPESIASDTEERPLSPESLSEYRTMSPESVMLLTNSRSSSPESTASVDEYRCLSPDSPIPTFRQALRESIVSMVGYSSSSPASLADYETQSETEYTLLISEIEDRPDSPDSTASVDEFRALSPDSPVPKYTQHKTTTLVAWNRPASPESICSDTESEIELFLVASILLQDRCSSPESIASIDECRALSPDSPIPQFRQMLPESAISTIGYRSSSPESFASDIEYVPLISESLFYEVRPDSPESLASVDEHRSLTPESPIPQFTQITLGSTTVETGYRSSSTDSITSDMEFELVYSDKSWPEKRAVMPKSVASVDEHRPLTPEAPVPDYREALPKSASIRELSSTGSVLSDSEHLISTAEYFPTEPTQLSPESVESDCGETELSAKSLIPESVLPSERLAREETDQKSMAGSPIPGTTMMVEEYNLKYDAPESFPDCQPMSPATLVLKADVGISSPESVLLEKQVEKDRSLSPESAEYRPMSLESAMSMVDVRTYSPESMHEMNDNRSLSPDSTIPQYTISGVSRMDSCNMEYATIEHRSSSPESMSSGSEYELMAISPSALESRPSSPDSLESVGRNRRLSPDSPVPEFMRILSQYFMEPLRDRTSSPESVSSDTVFVALPLDYWADVRRRQSSPESRESDEELSLVITGTDPITFKAGTLSHVTTVLTSERVPLSPKEKSLGVTLLSVPDNEFEIDQGQMSTTDQGLPRVSGLVAEMVTSSTEWTQIKHGSEHAETIPTPQATIGLEDVKKVQKDVPVNQQPVKVQKDVPVNQQPVKVQKDVPVNQQPVKVQKDMPVNQQPVKVQKDVPVNQQPVKVQDRKEEEEEVLCPSADTINTQKDPQRAPSQTAKEILLQTGYGKMQSELKSTMIMESTLHEQKAVPAFSQETRVSGLASTKQTKTATGYASFISTPLQISEQDTFTTHRAVTPKLKSQESSDSSEFTYKVFEQNQSGELFSPMSSQFLVPPDYEAVFSGRQSLRVSECSQVSPTDMSPVSPVFSDSLSDKSQVTTTTLIGLESASKSVTPGSAEAFEFSPDFKRVLNEFEKSLSAFGPDIQSDSAQEDSDLEFFDCNDDLSDFLEPEDLEPEEPEVLYHIEEPPSPTPFGSTPETGFLKGSPLYSAQFLRVDDQKRFSSGSESLGDYGIYDRPESESETVPTCEELPSRSPAGYDDDEYSLERVRGRA
ncbi:mucin-2-like [Salvelinus alpinus]|uniref:mucin-2-like n=1 Tax=Salvelinus alpinus TaxID=8036 RepID=UPI0039FD9D8F